MINGTRVTASVMALLGLVFLGVLLRTAWLSDDALITLRTVLNVTHGYGLTFNVAERVQTFTHPLWMFLLTGAYLVVGNVYYATLGLSAAVSLLTFWLALRRAASPMQVWLVVAVLLLSRAFVDFSTSGLENPLSHLLLIAFTGLLLSPPTGGEGPPRIRALWLVASLLYLTRPDSVILVAPALAVMTVRASGWRIAERQVRVGLLPAVAWTLFAIVYYGFPFPNTAYAKLGTGIDRGELVSQGLFYLLDSLDRDPVTLVTIAFAVLAGLATRGPARWLAGGVLLDLAYVVWIGGDFMAGRFLSVPLFASVLILGRLITFEPSRALTATAVLTVVGLASAQIPLLSDSQFDRTNGKPTGIVDERAIYFRTQSLVLANRQSFARPEWPTGRRQPVPTSVLDTCGLMGATGLDWGPMTHLLDECALADPLLARLPAIYNHEWRTGHFRRLIPDGYRESLELGANRLTDVGLRPLYDDLRTITRADRLLSRERLAAIWRVNTGASQGTVNWRFYRHGGSIASLEDVAVVVADGTPAWTVPARTLDVPLAIFCDNQPGRRYLDITLDSDDQYLLLFLDDGALVTTMQLGPIPPHRREPGLAAYTEDLPARATRDGFDTVIVAPLAGDSYGFGHLLLDGYAPTEAELERRVAARNRLTPR